MIASELVRLRFQALLGRGLAATEVARRSGLAGVSEVWGGGEPRDGAAWYVWLHGRPGAYRLDLDEARTVGDGAGAPALGRLAIRYYPSRRDAELPSFSPEERAIVEGDWLDGTGTPRIEHAATIPDGLFGVGSLELAVDPDAGTLLLALGSLDRLRIDREAPWRGDPSPLAPLTGAGGERTRDVPGWALAAPVFYAVAGIVSRLERPATRLVLARQAGFHLVHGRAGVECRDTSERVQGDAVLLFGARDGGRTPGAALLEQVLGEGAERVHDLGVDDLACGERIVLDRRLPFHVDRAWFEPAGPQRERATCGC